MVLYIIIIKIKEYLIYSFCRIVSKNTLFLNDTWLNIIVPKQAKKPLQQQNKKKGIPTVVAYFMSENIGNFLFWKMKCFLMTSGSEYL